MSLAAEIRPLLIPPGEVAGLDVPGRIDAAVLVPIFEREGVLHVVVTRRREDMRRHAGEISFPGGRQDIDEEDLRVTALREAEEEIGLAPADVDVVGGLAPTATFVTNYAVYPFVGIIAADHHWRPNAAEVAEVLELPLPALRESHEHKLLMRRGVPFRTHVFAAGEHVVWGATGRMLADLIDRLEPLLGARAARTPEPVA